MNLTTTVISNFPTSITKTYGDSSFNITNPSSNNPSGFSYTSSNPSVATISGNTVTINDVGSSTITVTQQPYAASNNLQYIVYNGYFNDDVNWFNSASILNNGSTTNISSISSGTNGYIVNETLVYSVQWLGYFKPDVTGTWTFYTESDDSSLLWLGSNAVSGYTVNNALVNNSGTHGLRKVSNSITLNANTYYPFRIQFGNYGGPSGITFSFRGPAGSSAPTETTNSANFFYNNLYTSGSATSTLTVAKADPTITNFPTSITKTYTDGTFILVDPSSNSNGAFSYTSSNSLVATIIGNVVTITGAGTATITATQAATSNYNSGSPLNTLNLTVTKSDPNFTTLIVPIDKVYSNSPFNIANPSSNSTGTFSYTSSNPLVATILGNTVTITGHGSTTITATQQSTNNFNSKSVTATFNVAIPSFPICFPAGTPVLTDQGEIAIEKINPIKNTIIGKKIVAITKTVTIENTIVCIEKDAFGKCIPSQKTLISRNHKLFYNKQMIKAKNLIGQVDGVYNKKYNGEILYNVLLETHEKMLVNNIIVETLDPTNIIANLYNGTLSEEQINNVIININHCANEYKKQYSKLK